MGVGEIAETYMNSVSKNTPETDIFPHGPKFLLTGVIFSLWFFIPRTVNNPILFAAIITLAHSTPRFPNLSSVLGVVNGR